MIYAIEIVGYGTKRRYCLKAITRTGTNPVDGRVYRSEDAARAAAAELGLIIAGCGDLYQLLSIARAAC